MRTNSALYQRVSDGTDKSVEDQNKANEAAARSFGWETVTFSDKVSASRFTKQTRPGWDALVAEVQAGRFSYVVLWESSRGDRKLATWAAFLDACRETSTGIYVTSEGGRLYDVRNGRDWRDLATDGVDAALETEKTSDRTRRGVAGAAELGLPYGRIPYGYRRYYTHEAARKKPLPHQEISEEEAPVVREVVERIARGEAISALVKDLDARGITTRAGGAWSRSSVVRLVTEGVVYIGKRRHNGSPLVDGNWPAIVKPDVYWRAVAVLNDPARKRSVEKGGGIRPGNARWLLSYITRCAKCGGPLTMRHVPRSAGQTAIYRCVNGCVSAPVDWLDTLATAAIVRWCASPIAYEVITGNDDREAQAARDEAATERARLADFEEQAADGKVSAASFARIAARIEARIAELDHRAVTLAAPPALRALLADASPEDRDQDIYDRWLGMPVAARRKVIATLSAPVLRPAGRGGNPLDPFRFSMNIKVKARSE